MVSRTKENRQMDAKLHVDGDLEMGKAKLYFPNHLVDT